VSHSDSPTTWQRTPEGYCSCPYCTAIREGRLERPRAHSPWLERMGAYGRSKATTAIFGEEG
jgi:hypothetical protein